MKDFFLTVANDKPHGPYLSPPPYNTMYEDFCFDDNPNYEDDLSQKPLMQRLWAGDAINKTKEEINRPSKKLSLFLGCNSFVDYEIGKDLDKIRNSVPNAMVIYTSDHGDMLGNHRIYNKDATCYKEAANIPFIIKGGEAGKVVTAPASHIDLAPTILDYMGLPIPKLMMVIPSACAEVMLASRPRIGTLNRSAKISTYLLKFVSRIYSPKSSSFRLV